MAFSGPLRVEWVGDGVHWRVIEKLLYTDPDGRVWALPAGTVIDGASIPRIFWSLVGSPMTGLYVMAAAMHDAAYQTPGMVKSQADTMLYEAMRELGCDRAIADIIYEAVRIAGQSSFNADQVAAASGLVAA